MSIHVCYSALAEVICGNHRSSTIGCDHNAVVHAHCDTDCQGRPRGIESILELNHQQTTMSTGRAFFRYFFAKIAGTCPLSNGANRAIWPQRQHTRLRDLSPSPGRCLLPMCFPMGKSGKHGRSFGSVAIWKVCLFLASRRGLEPLTPGLGNLCSIQLSYRDSDQRRAGPKLLWTARAAARHALSMNFRFAHRSRALIYRAGRSRRRLRCALGHRSRLSLPCGLRAGRGTREAFSVDERLDIELSDGRIVRLGGLDAPEWGTRRAGDFEERAGVPGRTTARPGRRPHPIGRRNRSLGENSRRPRRR